MAQDFRFFDRIAEKYLKSPISDEASYQTKLEKTRALLSPESRVLEFGCGTGTTALLHAPLVTEILAVDGAPSMIEIAKRQQSEAEVATPNLRFETADFDDMPLSTNDWDVVMAMSVLHLVPDHRVTIAKAFEVVTPGGVFVTSTTCMADAMGWFRPIAAAGRWFGRLPLLRFFTQSQLEADLVEAGFALEDVWRPEGRMKAVFIVARKPV